VQPEVNVLAAFASTIIGAFAVGLPMAVAIVCNRHEAPTSRW